MREGCGLVGEQVVGRLDGWRGELASVGWLEGGIACCFSSESGTRVLRLDLRMRWAVSEGVSRNLEASE